MKTLIQTLTNNDVPALIKMTTVVKLNKKDVATKTEPNPYTEVTKTSVLKVLLNPAYEKAVQDATNNPEFQASERKWGENIGNGLVDKDGEIYVSFIAVETVSSEYFADGSPVEYSQIKPFVPVKKDSGNPVAFRSVKLSNISSIELS